MTTEKQELICVRTDCPGTAAARLGATTTTTKTMTEERYKEYKF